MVKVLIFFGLLFSCKTAIDEQQDNYQVVFKKIVNADDVGGILRSPTVNLQGLSLSPPALSNIPAAKGRRQLAVHFTTIPSIKTFYKIELCVPKSGCIAIETLRGLEVFPAYPASFVNKQGQVSVSVCQDEETGKKQCKVFGKIDVDLKDYPLPKNASTLVKMFEKRKRGINLARKYRKRLLKYQKDIEGIPDSQLGLTHAGLKNLLEMGPTPMAISSYEQDDYQANELAIFNKDQKGLKEATQQYSDKTKQYFTFYDYLNLSPDMQERFRSAVSSVDGTACGILRFSLTTGRLVDAGEVEYSAKQVVGCLENLPKGLGLVAESKGYYNSPIAYDLESNNALHVAGGITLAIGMAVGTLTLFASFPTYRAFFFGASAVDNAMDGNYLKAGLDGYVAKSGIDGEKWFSGSTRTKLGMFSVAAITFGVAAVLITNHSLVNKTYHSVHKAFARDMAHVRLDIRKARSLPLSAI